MLRAPARLLTACGSSSGGGAQTEKATAAGYPVTIDNCGAEVTLESAPKRAPRS